MDILCAVTRPRITRFTDNKGDRAGVGAAGTREKAAPQGAAFSFSVVRSGMARSFTANRQIDRASHRPVTFPHVQAKAPVLLTGGTRLFNFRSPNGAPALQNPSKFWASEPGRPVYPLRSLGFCGHRSRRHPVRRWEEGFSLSGRLGARHTRHRRTIRM